MTQRKDVSTIIVSELSVQINDLLRPMGITRNLIAYSILYQCLELVCEQEDRLQAVEKDIYTPIAETAEGVSQKRFKALSAGQLKVHGSQTRSMCSSWQAIR